MRAQEAPTLVVSPPVGVVIINNGNTITLELVAANVVDMQSFDLTLAYDPAILQYESWALGELVSTFNWQLGLQTSPPGHFYLAYGRIGPGAVSGDGVLIRVTFSGVGAGTSPITITQAAYAKSTGVKTSFDRQHGSLTVAYEAVQPDKSAVSGTVVMQGRAGRAGVPVTLAGGALFGQGPYVATSTNHLRLNLDFGLVVHDTYTFTTARPGYLNLAEEVTVGGVLTLPPLRMLAGDVLGDGLVGSPDLDAIREAYGLIGLSIPADVNGDSLVDVRDLALVGGNFGLTSLSAYADWLP